MKNTGNKILKFLILLIAFSLSSFAQSVEKSKTGKKQKPVSTLENAVWLVTEIKDFVLPELEYQPRVRFFRRENHVTATAGCNHVSGRYVKTGKYNLAINRILTTAKRCDKNENDVEKRLAQSLKIINRFEIKNRNLYLFQDKKLLLILTAEVSSENSR